MFENIKTSFFIKKIFSFIDERKKLKIIKYNKSLQNCVDINLINYQFFSWRYIVYEKDGKGKEYFGANDTLLFEGEYLHGERNGNGKEFPSIGKLMFEGEYLNGKRNGKGKEYYPTGKLMFEGEYLNNEKIKGKQYGLRGEIKLEFDLTKIKI